MAGNVTYKTIPGEALYRLLFQPGIKLSIREYRRGQQPHRTGPRSKLKFSQKPEWKRSLRPGYIWEDNIK
jgi:hypothetical protein